MQTRSYYWFAFTYRFHGGERPGADRARFEVRRKARKREKIPELAAKTHRVRGIFFAP